jgi:hypothetical protein
MLRDAMGDVTAARLLNLASGYPTPHPMSCPTKSTGSNQKRPTQEEPMSDAEI